MLCEISKKENENSICSELPKIARLPNEVVLSFRVKDLANSILHVRFEEKMTLVIYFQSLCVNVASSTSPTNAIKK